MPLVSLGLVLFRTKSYQEGVSDEVVKTIHTSKGTNAVTQAVAEDLQRKEPSSLRLTVEQILRLEEIPPSEWEQWRDAVQRLESRLAALDDSSNTVEGRLDRLERLLDEISRRPVPESHPDAQMRTQLEALNRDIEQLRAEEAEHHLAVSAEVAALQSELAAAEERLQDHLEQVEARRYWSIPVRKEKEGAPVELTGTGLTILLAGVRGDKESLDLTVTGTERPISERIAIGESFRFEHDECAYAGVVVRSSPRLPFAPRYLTLQVERTCATGD